VDLLKFLVGEEAPSAPLTMDRVQWRSYLVSLQRKALEEMPMGTTPSVAMSRALPAAQSEFLMRFPGSEAVARSIFQPGA